MAFYCLKTMLDKHYQKASKLLNYKITYIGGWPQVIEFLKQMNTILPYKQGMVFAYLDLDAKTSLAELERLSDLNIGQQKNLNDYKSVRKYVSFLHITPEIGIWQWIVNNEQIFLEQWRNKTGNPLFQLNNSISYIDESHHHVYTSDSCKMCIKSLLSQLVCTPEFSEEDCMKIVIEIYYCQAVFNSTIWQELNQKLYQQLNM